MGARFHTTRWSIVRAAGGRSQEEARSALAALFEGYWFPVYGFVRSQGFDEEDARDLAQDYFARMLEKRTLDGLHPREGRFRSFLLASLRNFLHNERDSRAAEKRGGGKTIESSITRDRRTLVVLQAQPAHNS